MTKERPNKATIFIYCTPAEKAMILKASHRAEKNMSEFSRVTLIEKAEKLIEASR